jgi:hypothetical protein
LVVVAAADNPDGPYSSAFVTITRIVSPVDSTEVSRYSLLVTQSFPVLFENLTRGRDRDKAAYGAAGARGNVPGHEREASFSPVLFRENRESKRRVRRRLPAPPNVFYIQ